MAATAHQQARPVPAFAASPAPVAAAPTSPVRYWATAGALLCAFIAYLLVRWVTGGAFQDVPAGATPVPDWMKVSVRTWEVLSTAIFVGVMYWFVYRPWRRDGHLSWDGLFTLACGTLWWQDLLQNYVTNHALFNAYFLDFGSWYRYIPGWLPSNSQNIIESPLYGGTWYLSFMLLCIIFLNKVMARAQARWPHWSKGQLILFAIGVGCFMDAVLDPLYLRTGLYTYAGAVDSLTLWSGHFYQFPLYEIPTIGAWFGLTAAVRYFRDDKGMSIAERGAEHLRVTGARRTWVRFFALTAVVNLLFFATYCLPLGIFAVNGSEYPKDVRDRSYFVEGTCGQGTDRACPGERIPHSRPGGLYVTTTGQLAP